MMPAAKYQSAVPYHEKEIDTIGLTDCGGLIFCRNARQDRMAAMLNKKDCRPWSPDKTNRREGAFPMIKTKSGRAGEIPLYLIPHAITGMIRKRGEKVCRISVSRTHFHHSTIPARARLPPRELRVREKVTAPVPEPAGDDGDRSGDDGEVIA